MGNSTERTPAPHYTSLSALRKFEDLSRAQQQVVRIQIHSVINSYDNPDLLVAALVALHTLKEEQYHYPSPGVPFMAVSKKIDVSLESATLALRYASEQKFIKTENRKNKMLASPLCSIQGMFSPSSPQCTLFGLRTLLKKEWLTPPEARRAMESANDFVKFFYHRTFTFSQETMQELRNRSLSGLEAIYDAEMDFLRERCEIPEEYNTLKSFDFVSVGENACRRCKKTLPTSYNFRASFASVGEAFSAGFDAATGFLRNVYSSHGGHLSALLVRCHDGRYDFSLENTTYTAAQVCTFAIQQKNQEILKELQGKLEKMVS